MQCVDAGKEETCAVEVSVQLFIGPSEKKINPFRRERTFGDLHGSVNIGDLYAVE